jgi:toxin secretion/phage lysis holin
MDRVDLLFKGLATGAAAFWGGLIPLVQLLILLMAIDIASGVLVAIQRRELSSDIAWRGMTRKAMALLVVAAAGAVEYYATTMVGSVPLQAAVAGFYCGAELLSCLENAAGAGLPVPGVLKDVMAKLNPDGRAEGQVDRG